MPEIPTIVDAGVPGYAMINGFGMMALAKTPGPIVGRLSQVLVESLRGQEVRSRFEALGAYPAGKGAAALADVIRREMDEYAKVVKAVPRGDIDPISIAN